MERLSVSRAGSYWPAARLPLPLGTGNVTCGWAAERGAGGLLLLFGELGMSAKGTSRSTRSRAARRASGAYYTPAEIAAYIVRQVLRSLTAGGRAGRIAQLRILDPACGHGVFLLEAYKLLCKEYRKRRPSRDPSTGAGRQSELPLAVRKRIVLRQLYGVDQDPEAVQVTRGRLAQICLDAAPADGRSDPLCTATGELTAALANNIRRGNALVDPRHWHEGTPPQSIAGDDPDTGPFDWCTPVPELLPVGGFDAVIGNPPYLNIRQLTNHQGESVKQYFRQRFQCARGAYDSYVLFIERAFQLLRDGGVCGMIVPNKIATMDYARRCRELLLEETTLCHIDDVSDIGAFPGTGVYPYILVWRKRKPPAGHKIRVRHVRCLAQLDGRTAPIRLAQRDLSAAAGLTIHGRLDVESRVPTARLDQRAALHSGTTGFVAHRVAAALQEALPQAARRGARAAGDAKDELLPPACFEFIVSGNIDRYRVRLGDVRFMNRLFHRPVLAARAGPLSDAKRRLYGQPKIVVAGLTRRLEAAWDPGGLALGVQVYALTGWRDDPRYLLGLLNGKLLSYLFRIRFQAKRLSGGYLAINKGQLGRLPIPVIDRAVSRQRACHDRIIQCVDSILRWHNALLRAKGMQAKTRIAGLIDEADRQIDEATFRLYGLSPCEAGEVQASFQPPR